MKKFLKTISAVTMVAIMLMSNTAFAADNGKVLVSSKQITLSPSRVTSQLKSITQRPESKEFTLETYNDNGVTVYSIDVEEQEYCEAAMQYINQLTGDPISVIQQGAPLRPGESEYHNDTQDDGPARSYAWKQNTASYWDNNFEGGQSTTWTGSGNCDYIVLNQGISVSGIAVSISWPPSISGSGNSGSWQSQPIYRNSAGATFKGLKVGGTAFSCTFTENGDVYKGGRVYRPVTYIKFSYFS